MAPAWHGRLRAPTGSQRSHSDRRRRLVPMTVFSTDRPCAGWFPSLAAVLLAAGGSAVGVHHRQPPAAAFRTAAAVAAARRRPEGPRSTGLSGTIVQNADLGLPSLPGVGGSGSSDMTSLVAGSHTLRLWYAGPNHVRLALLGSLGESDLVRNGTDLWTLVEHGQERHPPHRRARRKDRRTAQPRLGVARDPAAGGRRGAEGDHALDQGQHRRYGRRGRPVGVRAAAPAPGHRLAGRLGAHRDRRRDPRADPGPGVRPGAGKPAFEVGFTSFDPSTPAASVFRFNPPPGTKVTQSRVARLAGPRPRRAGPDRCSSLPPPSGAPTGSSAPAGPPWSWPRCPPAARRRPRRHRRPARGCSRRCPGSAAAGARVTCCGARCSRPCSPTTAGVAVGAVAPGRPLRGAGAPMTAAAVATSGLTKRFGHQVAVDALDLLVPAGRGLRLPRAQRLRQDDDDPDAARARHADGGRRSSCSGRRCPAAPARCSPRVGALVEGPAFHPYLSGRANLARLDAADRTTDPRTARARVDAALDRVGLLAAATKQLPRLLPRHAAAARDRQLPAALARPPGARRADERPRPPGHPRGPVAGRARSRTRARTVLVSSHLLSEVEQMCSHVGVMHVGRLRRAGHRWRRCGRAPRPQATVETDQPQVAARIMRELGLRDVAHHARDRQSGCSVTSRRRRSSRPACTRACRSSGSGSTVPRSRTSSSP